jgi:hypothetical protein
MLHHVFFWLKNPSSESDKNELIEGLQGLKDTETPKAIHIGVPAATPAREVVDHSYDVSLLVTFDSLADHDRYQEHPAHLRFVENCSHLWERVQVYDIEPV